MENGLPLKQLRNGVTVELDEDVMLVGDGSPILSENALAKYYNKFVKLNEDDMPLGDVAYWHEFKN